MPFQMKIQPIDSHSPEEPTRLEPGKPVVKSRLKRLFELQFRKNSVAEKAGVADESHFHDVTKGSTEFEPSSLCLSKMVQNFIEESNEKPSSAVVKCGRNRCHCFNVNCNDSSEDEFDGFSGLGDSNFVSSGEGIEILKVEKFRVIRNVDCYCFFFSFLFFYICWSIFCNTFSFMARVWSPV